MLDREFPVEETHGFVNLTNSAVSRTSAGLGWSNVHLSVQSEGPYARRFEALPAILVSVVNVGPIRAHIKMDEDVRDIRGPSRSLCIFPDRMAFDANLQSPIKTTHVHLRRTLLDEVAEGICRSDPSTISIFPRLPIMDPLLEQICHAIEDALDDDPNASALYVDHMSRALAAHLIQKHSNADNRFKKPTGMTGLSAQRLNRTREIIEARLNEHLTIADLAADAGVGVDHFGRLFKQSTGMSLYQFVIRCRIDRASRLLAETSMSIAEVALECGFADQVHLTRMFGRLMGQTPGAFRRERRK